MKTLIRDVLQLVKIWLLTDEPKKISFSFVCIFWDSKDDAAEAHSLLKEENT